MINLDLKGKSVLLTGSLGAISEHIVRRLSEAGAHLVLTDIVSPDKAIAYLQAWGLSPETWTYFEMDVTDTQAVDAVVERIFEQQPNLDIALGHAGGCGLHPFAEAEPDEYKRIFDFNFFGQINFTRSVLKHWTQRQTAGHLLYTSSYVAQIPHQGISAYAPAKAALENLIKCLALEYAEHNIRFNAVSPGNVAAGSSLKVYNEDEQYRTFVQRATPAKRQNTPESIADAVVFMCSPLAQEINGHVMNVDLGIKIPKIG
ncbi:SDR family NAD(P)-dependent oxidoreductase [Poriferisphaera sp. WC338]|uniref:SDR family NAD(P)-dependent oxidoreductase n=1 Tax=Poriferisphaera sp. WC338 TaxID=3425129 RepID=UPI003D818C55